MRVAFVSACNGCKLKCGCAPNLGRANRLRRCAIPRRHSPSLCAATGIVAPPLLDGRKSVSSTALAMYVCKHRCERNPNLGKQHAPPRHHSPKSCSLCAATGTVAPPLLDGRKSVPSITHANMCASIGVTGYPRSGKLPAPSRHRAPSLFHTLAGCARRPAHSRRRFSMLVNLFPRPPAPTCVQASV